jgi:hypothetical protein
VIFLWSLNVLAEAQPAAVIEECRRDNCVTQECGRYQCLSCGIEEGTPALIHRLAELSHRSHPPYLSTETIGKVRADSAEDRNVVGNYRVAVPRSSRRGVYDEDDVSGFRRTSK